MSTCRNNRNIFDKSCRRRFARVLFYCWHWTKNFDVPGIGYRNRIGLGFCLSISYRNRLRIVRKKEKRNLYQTRLALDPLASPCVIITDIKRRISTYSIGYRDRVSIWDFVCRYRIDLGFKFIDIISIRDFVYRYRIDLGLNLSISFRFGTSSIDIVSIWDSIYR